MKTVAEGNGKVSLVAGIWETMLLGCSFLFFFLHLLGPGKRDRSSAPQEPQSPEPPRSSGQ